MHSVIRALPQAQTNMQNTTLSIIQVKYANLERMFGAIVYRNFNGETEAQYAAKLPLFAHANV